jgi:hypothetical protein
MNRNERAYALIEELMTSQPKLSKGSMATLLYKQYPEVFKTRELTRSRIRYITGTTGSRLRKYIDVGDLPKEYQDVNELHDELPEEYQTFKWEPFQLPDIGGVWLILGDMHVPFHKNRVIMSAIEYAKRQYGKALKGLFLNGDFMDQYWSSWWPIDSSIVSSAQEIRASQQMLFYILNQLQPEYMVYKEANHEYRFQKMVKHNPQLSGVKAVTDAISIENLLAFKHIQSKLRKPCEMEVVHRGNYAYYKELAIIHGDELGRGTANLVNPARTAFLRTKSIVLTHHFHQTSAHSEQNLQGIQTPCWSVGCLCNIHPEYAPFAHLKSNHGFAFLDTRGKWDVRNLRIRNETDVHNA